MAFMDRRLFLKQALAGAGLAAFAGPELMKAQVTAAGKVLSAADRVNLGKTGITVSRMAIGSGTSGWNHASNQTRLGLEKFLEIVNHGHERGLNFWDCADQYGSHTFFREALKTIPRDRVVILTKSFTRDADGMKSDIERYQRELGTDHMDILLLHCLTDSDWPTKMKATMDVVSEAKARGVIRAHGVSCHSLSALDAAAECPWVDIILSRLNPYGVAMDGPAEKVVPILRKAHDNGKAVVAMKIAGAGEIVDRIQESLQFTLTRGVADAFTMGFESSDQMDQAFDKVAKVKV